MSLPKGVKLLARFGDAGGGVALTTSGAGNAARDERLYFFVDHDEELHAALRADARGARAVQGARGWWMDYWRRRRSTSSSRRATTSRRGRTRSRSSPTSGSACASNRFLEEGGFNV